MIQLKQVQEQTYRELNSFNSIRLQLEGLTVDDCVNSWMKQLLTDELGAVLQSILSFTALLEMIEDVKVIDISSALSDTDLKDDLHSSSIN